MSEISQLDAVYRFTFEGPAWHGPSILEILTPLEAPQAAAHPVPGAHSIWELVLHMISWEEYCVLALGGNTMGTEPPRGDWPDPPVPTEENWRATLEDMKRVRSRLRAALALVPDRQIPEKVKGRDYTYRVMMHGIVHHDLYHAGQIALLKKAL